jgi:amino acid transporter
MVFLIYGAACGGAFGLETMVSGSGPGVALLTLCVLPFFWSIPVSLACAELASTFPLEGGYYRWARMAFGDTVGFLTAWWTWVGIFATNAMFVVLFNQYLGYWFPVGFWPGLVISLALIWGVTYLNLRGIKVVGEWATWLTFALLIPFVILTVLGLVHWHTSPVVPFHHPEKSTFTALGEAMMVGVWLYSGYDKITVSAEEVENPARNFPLAFGIAVPFVAVSYVVPTLAAIAGHGHWQDWSDKYFSVVAGIMGAEHGLPWLGHAMTVGALFSNLILLNTTMLAQSRLPMAAAKDGLAPRVFARAQKRYATPVFSLVFGSVILSLLCLGSFSQLVTMYSVTQMIGYLTIYASLYKLRKSHPRTKRPFAVPGGLAGIVALSAPPVAIALLTLVKTDDMKIGVASIVSGPLALVAWNWFKKGRR